MRHWLLTPRVLSIFIAHAVDAFVCQIGCTWKHHRLWPLVRLLMQHSNGSIQNVHINIRLLHETALFNSVCNTPMAPSDSSRQQQQQLPPSVTVQERYQKRFIGDRTNSTAPSHSLTQTTASAVQPTSSDQPFKNTINRITEHKNTVELRATMKHDKPRRIKNRLVTRQGA